MYACLTACILGSTYDRTPNRSSASGPEHNTHRKGHYSPTPFVPELSDRLSYSTLQLLSVISFLVSWLKQAVLIVSILFPSRFGLSGMQSFSLLFHFLFPSLFSKPLFFFIAKLRLMVH